MSAKHFNQDSSKSLSSCSKYSVKSCSPKMKRVLPSQILFCPGQPVQIWLDLPYLFPPSVQWQMFTDQWIDLPQQTHLRLDIAHPQPCQVYRAQILIPHQPWKTNPVTLIPFPNCPRLFWADEFIQKINYSFTDGSQPNTNWINLTQTSEILLMTTDRKYLYWSNYQIDRIGRVPLILDSQAQTQLDENFIVIPGKGPYGVAVDDTYIYWTSFDQSRIERTFKKDPSLPETLLTSEDGVDLPIGLAVDETYLYWANRGTSNISRAFKDGKNPEILYSLPANAFPEGVVVDSKYVYWVTFNTNRLYRGKKDGSFLEVIYSGPNLQNPTGLAIDDNYLYWSNLRESSIYRISKRKGKCPQLLVEFPNDVNALGIALSSSVIET